MAGGVVVFSDFADGRLYRLDPGADGAVPITPAGPWRYADLRPDLARRRFFAVREDHGGDGEADEHDRGRPARRRRADGPRRGPGLRRRAAALAGRHAPRLARVGPPGHAVGRDPPAGRARSSPDGTLGESALAAGGPDESIVQPEWSPDGTLHLISDRSGWWNLYRLVDGPAARAARADGGRVRRSGLDLRSLVVRVPARRRDRGRRPGRAAATASSGSSRAGSIGEVEMPFTELDALRVGADRDRRRGRRAGRSGGRRPLRPGRRWRRPASCAGRARSPSTRRPSRGPSRSSSRRPAAGPPTRSTTRRPTRTSSAPDGEKPPLIVLTHGGPTSNASTALDLGQAAPDQPRDRRRRRRLRREHRLRPRLPPAARRAVGRRRRRRLRRGGAVPGRARRRRSRPAGDRGRQRGRLHDPRRARLP